MIDTSHPFAAEDNYRARAARRRIGTRFAMAGMAGIAAVIVAGMIYLVILVVTFMANMLGQQATGRIEERFKNGTAAAVVAVATLATDS